MRKKQPSVLPGAEMIWKITNREKGVLLLHGFLGTPWEMKYLAEKIHDAGYSVYVPRYPGHGTTIEDMTTTFADDWFGAAREAYLELSRQCREVYVAGLSMGSLFAVLLSSEFDIPKIVLMSMPAAIPDRTIYAAPVVKHFKKIFYRTEEQIAVFNKGVNNPEDRAKHVCYYQGTPVAQAWELHKTIGRAKAALPFVKSKALLVQSRSDDTIPLWSLDYIQKNIGTVKKESLELDSSNHVVCSDYEKDFVAEKVIRFLRS